MLIPCDAPLAEVVSAYLEAGDFTSSSRATYRRVLGELARDLGPILRAQAHAYAGNVDTDYVIRADRLIEIDSVPKQHGRRLPYMVGFESTSGWPHRERSWSVLRFHQSLVPYSLAA
jgi:hypothetical protein